MRVTVRLLMVLVAGAALVACGPSPAQRDAESALRDLRAALAEDASLSEAERVDILLGADALLSNGTCSVVRFGRSAAPEVPGVYWVGCEGPRYHAFRIARGEAEFCGSSAADCACGPGRAITGIGADGSAVCEP